MQKRRKLLSLSALVCALLLVFAFALVGCGNEEQTDGTNSGGGLDENYTSVPTEDVGTAPATLSLSQTSASIAYGGTLELRATVGNPVAGTVTWSVAAEGAEAITFEEGDDTDAITTDSATATLTLTGAAVTSTAYNVTATFVASDNANNTASASCAVTVVASNVTVNVTGTANALYTDGKETEKSATLTATVSGTSGAVIAWSKTDEDNLVTLNNNGDGTATVTLNSGVATVGTVTVTATVTYNDGTNESATASGDFTISVTKYALNTIATITFDSDSSITSGTSVTFATQPEYSGITATYGGGNGEIQSTTAHSGNAFRIASGANTGAYFTFDFSGYSDTLVGDSETLSISFWSNIENNAPTVSGPDWSHIVTAMDGSSERSSIRYFNLNSSNRTDASDTGNGNVWPGGTFYNGGAWNSLCAASGWVYVTVEISATSISFYIDGTLILVYDSVNDPGNNNAVAAVCTDIRAAVNGTGTLKFFGNKEQAGDLYIDDVLLTKNISAADLYSAATAN